MTDAATIIADLISGLQPRHEAERRFERGGVDARKAIARIFDALLELEALVDRIEGKLAAAELGPLRPDDDEESPA